MKTISLAQSEAIINQLGKLPQFTLGRNPDNQIVLSSVLISGKHAFGFALVTFPPIHLFIKQDLKR